MFKVVTIAIKSQRNAIFGTILALVLGACGITSPYTPNPDRPFEPIPEFTSHQYLSLVNAQDNTTEIETGPFLVNRQAWTDVAIQIAERELKARGVHIFPKTSRTLRLSVTGVRWTTGWTKVTTEVDMRAEAGNGYTANYTGKNSSVMASIPSRQADGAMMRVVVELLKDPKIVSYLTE